MSGRVEEIVTLVTMCGEIIGRVASEDATTILLKSPLLFVPSGSDNEGGGFAPGISMTGAQNMPRGEFNKSCILTVIPAHPQVADGWLKATGSIRRPLASTLHSYVPIKVFNLLYYDLIDS